MIIWQSFLLLSIMFHHSNLRLPKPIEDCLVRLIVTPRMHGIHHSDQPENQNSNWSGGFTIWDSLHGTLNLGVPQEKIEVWSKGLRSSRAGHVTQNCDAAVSKRTSSSRIPGTR